MSTFGTSINILAEHHVKAGKSDGVKVIRAADIEWALATRTQADIERVEHSETDGGRDAARDPSHRDGEHHRKPPKSGLVTTVAGLPP